MPDRRPRFRTQPPLSPLLPISSPETSPNSNPFPHPSTMYSGHATAAAFALRAKRSFALHHHHQLRLSDDANNNSSSSESYHSLISVSPRVLLYRYYYSRHSALVRWAPSHRIVSVGGSRYSRLAAGCCCCCYCGGGGGCNVGGSDGRFQGMLGLLAEAEGEAVVGTVEFAKVEKLGYRDMGDGGRRRMKEARSCEGEDFVRGGDYSGRRVGKGDDFPKSGVQRRGRSKLSTKSGFRNGYSEQWGSGSANSVQSEVVRERETSSSSLSNSAVRAKREEHVRKEKRPSREEREKISSALEARGSDRKKFSDANVEKKEEVSALALSLLEEVRRQRSEIDELNKNYQTLLLKRSEEEHATSVRAATSIQASSSKLEGSEQISTALVDLVDELKKQRVEIDRLLRSHQELITSSEIHETDVKRISSLNELFLSRSRDREESSTSTLNLIEEEKQQHNHAEQLRKEYQRNAPSSRKRESNAQKVSGAHNSSALVLNDRDESSTSVVNSVDKLKEQYIHSDQFRRDYEKLNESSEIHEINTNRASTSSKVAITSLEGREQSTTLDANLIVERRASTSSKVDVSSTTGREQSSTLDANLDEDTKQQQIPFGQFRKDKNALMKSSEIHEIDTKTASTSNKVTTISSKGSEQSSSLAGNFLEERRQQHTSVDQVRIDDSTLWQSSKMREVGSTERASSSKESMEKTSDSAVYLFGESAGQLGYNDQFRKDEYTLLKSAVAQKADIDRSSSSYRVSISKSTDAEKRSTSAVNLIEEGQKKYYHTYQPYQETVGSGHSEETSDVEERIIDLPMSSGMELENAEGSSSLMMVQEAERPKVNVFKKSNSSGWKLTAESFGRVSDGSSSTACLDDQQLDEQSGWNDLVRVKHDMLDSARRLDESSSQYVGDFVDKLREEVLVSDESDAMSKYSSGINMEMTLLEDGQSAGGSQHGVVDGGEDYKLETILQEGPGQSSASCEEKGPSDEMWDASDPSFVAPSRKEKPEKEAPEVAAESTTMPANSGNAIVKRSGRSMWSFIADIIRMGWITRAESHKSTVQSGTRSSSNESVSSDAWFSGHEPEEEDDERTKKGRCAKAKEPLLSKIPVGHQKSELQVSGHEAEATSENRLAKEPAGGSQFVGTTGRTNVSVDSLTVSESGTSTAGGKDEFSILSAGTAAVLPSVAIDSSALPMTQLEITGIHTTEMHGIGFAKSIEEPVGGNLAGLAEIEVKDSDLRKRKFQRNKQVPREKFEEWEEAHKLEMEQRKVDEFFMREALLEAKKAADTWEVPIGAVLVQNGNVIARGSNLVEELRDSTAHAEMICIREASNLLRTWRLSDTTLYVTLEPCPMCAGAILQARVDTVVWGAPNKLLGADGSWVRLFPGGDGGKDDLGQSSQTAGPVHPFHPKISIRRGILATECSEVMQQFFQLRRKKDKKKEEEPEPPHLPISSYPKKLFTRMHDIFSMMFCL